MNCKLKSLFPVKFIFCLLMIPILFISGCKSLFPEMLTMDEKDFKSGIHKVLLLPVYIDENELIPSSAEEFNLVLNNLNDDGILSLFNNRIGLYLKDLY
jgi:hypothetical protein